MSIALQSSNGGGDAIRRSRFIHGVPCLSIYDSSEPKVFAEDRRRLERESDSCSSSSVGRNSDLSGGSSDGDDSADDEVQSSFKGPLDTMDALEEVLPTKYVFGWAFFLLVLLLFNFSFWFLLLFFAVNLIFVLLNIFLSVNLWILWKDLIFREYFFRIS